MLILFIRSKRTLIALLKLYAAAADNTLVASPLTLRIVTRLPPMGSPTKSRRQYPFFTTERAPQQGQHLIRSFVCAYKIILLPLYSSQVHSWV